MATFSFPSPNPTITPQLLAHCMKSCSWIAKGRLSRNASFLLYLETCFKYSSLLSYEQRCCSHQGNVLTDPAFLNEEKGPRHPDHHVNQICGWYSKWRYYASPSHPPSSAEAFDGWRGCLIRPEINSLYAGVVSHLASLIPLKLRS